ncbi:50S ribosomal protein L7/L12 [candidate division Kazan bacterium]|uniref:Large ribosomal subunit protein bL12 n=1 Tax=candidate division Kazan bacterium TaxID=2202143 RepID=A0A420ZD72_UNCK3|nr:MAG: 50S ribosomal protein L7/L12 [candidate division Kazan bacterium]
MVEEPQAEESKAEPANQVDTSKLSDTANKVLDMVSEMTILELAELVKVLEDKFGVSAAPAVAAVAGGAAGEASGETEGKSTYNVNLTDTGSNKIGVIKAVREVTELGLKEAKDLVEAAPKLVRENVKKEEAEEIKKKLEAAGAKVELT